MTFINIILLERESERDAVRFHGWLNSNSLNFLSITMLFMIAFRNVFGSLSVRIRARVLFQSQPFSFYVYILVYLGDNERNHIWFSPSKLIIIIYLKLNSSMENILADEFHNFRVIYFEIYFIAQFSVKWLQIQLQQLSHRRGTNVR